MTRDEREVYAHLRNANARLQHREQYPNPAYVAVPWERWQMTGGPILEEA